MGFCIECAAFNPGWRIDRTRRGHRVSVARGCTAGGGDRVCGFITGISQLAYAALCRHRLDRLVGVPAIFSTLALAFASLCAQRFFLVVARRECAVADEILIR